MNHLVLTLVVLAGFCASVFGDAATPKNESQGAQKGKSQRAPTQANVRYGPHEREVLDFYQAKTEKPSPVVFYIHGGGWVAGDKKSVAGLEKYLAAGISVVSINYGYTTQAQIAGVKPPVQWPLSDAARALQFVRSKAAEWNLDKERIAATGVSAGACSSLWLAFHKDMADPNSADSVARESTRLWCAAGLEGQDEIAFVEAYLKAHSLTKLYDSVFIPIVTTIETDYRMELLDDAQRAMIDQSLRDIIRDLGARPRVLLDSSVNEKPADEIERPTPAAAEPIPSRRVYCLPARADRDELAGTMLAQLLGEQGVEALSASVNLTADDNVSLVRKSAVNAVCISVVAPSTVLHARYLCLKLRSALPSQRILVGLWGATEDLADAARRVRDSGADIVVTTLAAAVLELGKTPRLSVASPPA